MELNSTQQVKLQTYTQFAHTLSDGDLKDQVVGLYRQMMLHDNYYRAYLRQVWLGEGWAKDSPKQPDSQCLTPGEADRDSWLGETS